MKMHEGNLNDKQISYAKTIHSCGDDLIQLINDILDLSKIESGYISTDFTNLAFRDVTSFVETTFKHISENKSLRFRIELDERLPISLETDAQRLNQILKNLLSNAFKFTEKGEVRFRIFESNHTWRQSNPNLDNAQRVVAFEIQDTGIGISKDKQNIIFEAFQQAEGSTSRKYGGTGLGLSISRGLADLLGGSIELNSEAGQGSTFTLFLPIHYNPIMAKREKQTSLQVSEYKLAEGIVVSDTLQSVPTIKVNETKDLDAMNEIINETGDDRNNIIPGDKVVLVIEDDLRFGKIMIEKAHEMDLKVVVAASFGHVFDLVNKYSPAAITLDVKLPDASGWRILDLFKNDITLRHIPVHLISGEENRLLAMHRGAKSFHLKPLKSEALDTLFSDIAAYSRIEQKRLLIVEDNELDSSRIAKIMDNNGQIHMDIVGSGTQALEQIRETEYDGIIVDYMLPDIGGLELITEIANIRKTQPVLIYSARDFSSKERTQLKQYSSRILLKDVSSLDLLLDEIILLLHIDHKTLVPENQKLVENLRSKNDVLTHKKVLVVDDDVRNLFALTTAFERYNIDTITAESGQEAMRILEDNSNIDIVLMDIMMPEMDGYETTQKIRREHKNTSLPIIAVTAKAMKGDREKCIEAGASDYITKPVKIDQLLSLMRIWLYK
jgi:CheY-like chemotaxis protein/two-component sensor histidine kinase